MPTSRGCARWRLRARISGGVTGARWQEEALGVWR
jgi:hypothetical protein